MKGVNVVILVLACTSLATCGTMYGLLEGQQLATIDPKSYKVANIGNPIPSEIQAQSLASYDQTNHIYYFIGFNSVNHTTDLIGINVKDGSVALDYVLPLEEAEFVGVGQYVAVDPNTADVICIGLTDEGVHSIFRVVPSKKSHTLVGKFKAGDILGPFAAYDAKQNVIFVEVVPTNTTHVNIQGYDANTGKLVQDIEDTAGLETLSYDSKTGLFYGIGLKVINETSFSRTLVSFDGKTGEQKTLYPVDGYYIISSSISTFDPTGRILYSFLSDAATSQVFYLVGINVDTGKIVTNPQACTQDAECPWSIEFDSN